MPKIKVKNIPYTTRMRVCYNNMCGCSGCSLNMKDADTRCMISSKYRSEEKIVELSEKDFPTNREWLESLSNDDFAAFYTLGIKLKDNSYINLYRVAMSFTSSQQHIKEWLSQPCVYLMEEDDEKEIKGVQSLGRSLGLGPI